MADIVFVIGAGASMEYGFPTGTRIKSDVSKLLWPKYLPDDAIIKQILCNEKSRDKSIDSLAEQMTLEQRRRTGDLAAKHLLQLESASNDRLKSTEHSYHLLLSYISSLQKIGYEVLVINFNYDRLLRETLYHYNNKVRENSLRIDPNIIKNVFGTLPPLWHEMDSTPQKKYNYYGEVKSISDSDEKSLVEESSVNFIFEKSNLCDKAKKGLQQAHTVYFLGFGYNEQNMKLLGFEKGIADHSKKLYGTSFELPNHQEIKEMYGINLKSKTVSEFIEELDSTVNKRL